MTPIQPLNRCHNLSFQRISLLKFYIFNYFNIFLGFKRVNAKVILSTARAKKALAGFLTLSYLLKMQMHSDMISIAIAL